MAVKRVEEEKEKQGRYSSTFSDSCSRHFFFKDLAHAIRASRSIHTAQNMPAEVSQILPVKLRAEPNGAPEAGRMRAHCREGRRRRRPVAPGPAAAATGGHFCAIPRAEKAKNQQQQQQTPLNTAYLTEISPTPRALHGPVQSVQPRVNC